MASSRLKPASAISPSFLGRLGRSVSTLVSGSLLSQVVLIAASPAIARLFTPAEFAVLNVYTSVTTIFTTLSPSTTAWALAGVFFQS